MATPNNPSGLPLNSNDPSQIDAIFDFFVEGILLRESQKKVYREHLFPSE
jgi:hypothetical protein